MLDRYEHIQLKQLYANMTEDELRVHREVSEWAFNSHWWLEKLPGLLKCKWCEKLHHGHMKIEIDYPLCTENPALKKLIEKIVVAEKVRVYASKG